MVSLKQRGLGKKLLIDEKKEFKNFHEEYLKRNTPVILRGVAKDWPACGRWNLGYFAEHFPDTRQVIVESSGEKIFQDKMSRKKIETVTIQQIAESVDDEKKLYGNFSPLVGEHKFLRDQLKLDWLKNLQTKIRSLMMYQLFMGGAGTHTDLHSEISTNLFIQLYGKKRWLLCSPEFTPLLEIPVTREPCFHSPFDGLHHKNQTSSPFFPYIDYYEFDLNPGDILLVPPYWWHQVKNEEEAVGLAVKWHNPLSFYKASLTLTLLTTFSLNPPLWKLIGKGSYLKLFTDGRE
jgi:oxalate decarboxylase/phosphoglucose isomerase-like protein (cupin superfamily)